MHELALQISDQDVQVGNIQTVLEYLDGNVGTSGSQTYR